MGAGHFNNNGEFMEKSGASSELMNLWPNREKVILVDAVQSIAKPGIIHRLEGIRGKVSVVFLFSTSPCLAWPKKWK